MIWSLYEWFQIVLYRLAQLAFFLPHNPKRDTFLTLRDPDRWSHQLATLSQLYSEASPCEVAWIHVASAGELEQAKPVLAAIHRERGTRFVVTYFSPSTEPFLSNDPEILMNIGMPLDIRDLHRRLLLAAPITFVFLVRYDIWPSLLAACEKEQVPILLLAASSVPARPSPLTRFLSCAKYRFYRKMSYIFAISKDDAQFFKNLDLPGCILISGEPKWNRAKHRVAVAKAHQRHELVIINKIIQNIRLSSSRKVIVFGSPHQEEHAIAVKLSTNPDTIVIYVPHEVTPAHLESIQKDLHDSQVSSLKLSQINAIDTKPNNIRCIIVDGIGFLAEIYALADVAVIGGGFDGQIHNTLEAAAHGVPVVFGKQFSRAREAAKLVEKQAALAFATPDDMLYFLNEFVDSVPDRPRTAQSTRASDQVAAMQQAAARLFAEIPETSEVVLRALAQLKPPLVT